MAYEAGFAAMMDWIPFLSNFPVWVRLFIPLWFLVGVLVLVLTYRRPILKDDDKFGVTQNNRNVGHQENTQITAQNVYISQGAPREDACGGLHVSVANILRPEPGGTIYSDVVFNNRSSGDMTILMMMMGMGPTNSPMPHWKGLWEISRPEVVPASKSVTKTFTVKDDFLKRLQEDYGTPQVHSVRLSGRILTADGDTLEIDSEVGLIELRPDLTWSMPPTKGVVGVPSFPLRAPPGG